MKIFIILLIATMGLDRVDLAGGNLNFRLTPYISFGFLFMVYLLIISAFQKRYLKFNKNVPTYLVLLTLFLLTLLCSVILSGDLILSFSRYVLLVFNITTSFLLVLSLNKNKEPIKLIVDASKLGLILFLIFDFYQVLNFYFDYSITLNNYIDIVPPDYGGLAIRPSGFASDMNLGAFALTVYTFLIYKFQERSVKKSIYLVLAILMMAATLSRSGLLAFILMVIFSYFIDDRRINWKFIFKCILKSIILTLFLLIIVNYSVENMDNYFILLNERMSLSSGDSGGVHFELMRRGMETFFKNPFFGAGFGASYLDLNDIFDGNKYSNYHSLYITLLAEGGLFTFFLCILILIIPLFFSEGKNIYKPLLVALIIFNIFYQSILSPIFWIVLSFSWIGMAYRWRKISI